MSRLRRPPLAGAVAGEGGSCYIWLVNRAVAIALLLAIGLLPIAPIVIAHDAEAQLPTCCRMHGQHHCAAARAVSSGPEFEAINRTCPVFPKSGAFGFQHAAAALVVSRAIIGAIVSRRAAPACGESEYRDSYSQWDQKRGPPLVIS